MKKSLINNEIERIKKLKKAKEKRNTALAELEKLSDEIENKITKRSQVIEEQIEAENEYLRTLDEISQNKPVSIVEFAREIMKINNPAIMEEIDRDKTLQVDYGYSCSPIFTDMEQNGLFATKTLSPDKIVFVHNDEKDAELRLKVVVDTLKERIASKTWSGCIDAYFFVSGESGFVNVYAEINLAKRLQNGETLFDHIKNVEYRFMPTVKYGKAFYQIGVILGFDCLNDLTINLNMDSFCDKEDDDYIMLNNETAEAFYNLITRTNE